MEGRSLSRNSTCVLAAICLSKKLARQIETISSHIKAVGARQSGPRSEAS